MVGPRKYRNYKYLRFKLRLTCLDVQKDTYHTAYQQGWRHGYEIGLQAPSPEGWSREVSA